MNKKYTLNAGDRFGRLTLVELDHTQKYKSPKGVAHNIEFYLCVCDCGNTKIVNKQSLIYGKCKSCGCLEHENQKSKQTKHRTHSYTGTRLYKCWTNMKSRCYRKNDIDYTHYNKLGITVCKEWKNNAQAFIDWALHNGYKDDLTLDRINTYKGYSPSNCRWVTLAEQNRNQTQTVKINYKGKIYCLAELSRLLNIPRTSLRRKIETNKINATLL